MPTPAVSATPDGGVLLDLGAPREALLSPLLVTMSLDRARDLHAELADAIADAEAVSIHGPDDEPDRDDPAWFDGPRADHASAEDALGVAPGSLS